MKFKTPLQFTKLFFIFCLILGFFQFANAQADFTGDINSNTLTANTPFSVTIELESNGQLIDAAEVHLAFDPAILQITNLTTGSTNPLTTAFVPATFDNSAGTIDFAGGVQTPPAIPVDANFDVLVIEFIASQAGSTSLDFVNPNPPLQQTVAFLAGLDVLNSADPINLVIGSPNNNPIADFTASPNPAETNDIISFNAATSSDPDLGDTLTYDWNFGDGNTGNGQTIDYSYSAANTYNVTLTVDDGNGGTDSETKQIVVNTPTVTNYTITPSAGPNGSISPNSPVSVIAGGNQTFSIIPDAGYEVQDVLVDGNSVGAVTSYEFENVNAGASISATFTNINTTPVITLAATASVNEGGSISVPLSISDADDDNLTVTYTTLSNEPQLLQTTNAGKQVDPFPFDANGFFSESNSVSIPGSYQSTLDFIPTFGDGGGANGDGNGIYTLSVTVQDEDGNSISEDLIITVNDTPQFISETAITLIEAESFDNQGPPNPGSGKNGIGVEEDPLGFVNIGYTHLNDYMEFDVDVETSGIYRFSMQVAGPGTPGVVTAKTMDITSSLGANTTTFTFAGTGGFGNYATQTVQVNLQAGPQTLRFEWTGGGTGFMFNIDYIDVEFISAQDNPPVIDPIADVDVDAEDTVNVGVNVTDSGMPIVGIVIYDKSVGAGTNTDPLTSGLVVPAADYSFNGDGSGNYTLTWATDATDGRSYSATVSANDGVNPVVSETFTIDIAQDILAGPIKAATFNEPIPYYGSNPAAGYTVSVETSNNNIGWVDPGEFVEYLINVPVAGTYDMDVFASKGNNSGGNPTTLTVSEDNGGFSPIATFSVTNTGWNPYIKYEATVEFTNAGVQKLRFDFAGGMNIQQFEFELLNSNASPVVTISDPANGLALASGVSLDLAATAIDPEEGDLSTDINWSSDLDGSLGTGASISTVLTSIGNHTITAEITDNHPTNPVTATAVVAVTVTESDPSCDARFRVNAGGPALVANSGAFEEDQAAAANNAGATANPGTPSSYLNLTAPANDQTFGSLTPLVSNTTGYPEYLFQTERYSTLGNPNNMNWEFPTGNGVFDVKILFNENWPGELNNPRVFDVEIEGEIALDDYRPSVDGTQINVAKVETFQATVEDGVLTINFLKGTQNPSVKGFDICYVSDLPTDTPPTIVINTPTINGNPVSIPRGTQINFSATATDAEDDDTTLTNAISWSIDPFEPSFGGAGGSFTDRLFVPGNYLVNATVTDTDGNEVTDDIEITIEGPDVAFAFPSEGDILTDTEILAGWTATNMFFQAPDNEHFHIWVNPTDINNLDQNDRISTASAAGQLSWSLGAAEGIIEGQNTLVIIAAESGHTEFENSEAKDVVTFTVNLQDTTDPEITCPDDIVVSTDEDACGAIVNYAEPVGTDNNPGAVTTSISGSISGDMFPLGTTTVTYQVVDAAGNSAQCSFTITVNDDQAPEITCPPNISVVSLDGSPISIEDIGMATATDNCSAVLPISSVVLGSTDPIPTFFPVGTTVIQWSTVDEAGNPAFCNQSITVNFTPSADKDITAFALPNQVGPTAISGTSIAVTMPIGSDVSNLVPSSLVFSAGATISPAVTDAQDFSAPVDYVVTAQDNSTKIYTVNVTVLEDTTDPVVSCPGNIVVSNAAGECGAIVDFMASATDDQPGVVTSSSILSGSLFPVGTTVVTVTATDAAGNTDQCTFDITVNDTEAPEIVCPQDISVVSPDGSDVTINNIGIPLATDNCDQSLLFSATVAGTNNSIPFAYPVGTTIVQWATTDSAGNQALCTQSVTVTFTPSSDKDITAFELSDQVGPTAISGTSIAVTMPIGSDVTNLVPTSLVFSAGATISPAVNDAQDFSAPVDYVVTAQDNSTKTYTINVTVLDDTTDPVVSCPGNIIVSNAAGQCGAIVDFMASATDDQPGVVTSSSIPSGTLFPVGTTVVTVTATDAAGNTDQCTFDVKVNDTEAPEAICINTTITLNSSGVATLDFYSLVLGSTDNCDIADIVADKTTFTQADIGTNTVTITLSDFPGNSSSCTALVTVEPAVAVGNTELTVLDATTDTPLFDLVDGMVIQKSDIGNTPLGVIYNTSFNPGGVYFILSGPLTESRNEGPTPHSLFGDIGVDIQGKPFPVGNYVLSANPIFGPTLVVNFSVVDGPDPCENFDVQLSSAVSPQTCGGTDGEMSISVSGATAPLTYSWSHNSSLQGAIASGLSAGTYSVTVTDANGCSDSVTATLSEPTGINVQLSSVDSPETCGGTDGEISISVAGATAPLTYAWSHDASLQSAIASGLSAGTYAVTITDANGCSDSVSTTLNDPTSPTVSLSAFNAVLETDVSFALSGGLPQGGTYSGTGVTNGTFDPSVGVGNYTITYNYTDSVTGCSGSATTTLVVNPENNSSPLLVLDATDDSILFPLVNGMQISKDNIGNTPLGIIYDSSLNPGGVYFILSGPLTESRNEGPSPHSVFGDIGVDIQGKPFPVGNYTLSANPVVGPTLIVSFSVVDGPDPCENFDVQLSSAISPETCGGSDGEISISVSGASAPLTYSWSHNSSLQSATTSGLSAGSYSVTVTDANGCSDSLSVTLSEPAGINVQLSSVLSPQTCSGNEGEITVSVSGASAPLTYVWSHDNALQSATASGLFAGTYSVTVTDVNGCSDSVSTTLSDPASPTVTIGTFNAVLESDGPISLSGGSPQGGTYSGVGVSNNVFDPAIGEGIYTITYSYTDPVSGCSSSASNTIMVNPVVTPTLEILSYTLVDADTDLDILTITEGTSIVLSQLPTANLNIRANTTNDVASVRLNLSGALTQSITESVAPYSLYGDFPAGDYYASQLITGNYVISGTPYSLRGATGTTGSTNSLNFEVRVGLPPLQRESREMIISPNPTNRTATIVFRNPKKVNTISVFDGSGRLVKVVNGDPGVEISLEQVPVQDLQTGIYYVKIVDSQGREFQQQMLIKR